MTVAGLISNVAPFWIYAFFIETYRKRYQQVDFSSVSKSLVLFYLLTLAALSTSFFVVILPNLISSEFSITTLANTIPFVLGDLVGILVILPIVYIAKYLRTSEIALLKSKNRRFLVSVFLFVIAGAILATIVPGVEKYLNMYVFIPAI